MTQTNVLLLFGGESPEHDVSLASATNVFDAIDVSKYNIRLCYITRDGVWHLTDDISKRIDGPTLQADFGTGAFITSNDEVITPDVILPVLHGKNGEDGAVQGVAQLLHIPIVGCDMTASVLAMDKIASKALFIEAGLKTLPYVVHRSHETIPKFSDVENVLGSTIFVKPSRAGSSVGVSKVTNEAEFSKAISLAVKHDSLVLVEQAADHPREIEIAVLGNASDRTASIPGEIKPDGEFYSYDSKYNTSSQSKLVIPADLSDETSQNITAHALRAYDALHCEGLARVDFLLDAHDNFYINEINTFPGFTNISMYPKLWQANGLEYPDLIDKLLQLAILKSA